MNCAHTMCPGGNDICVGHLNITVNDGAAVDIHIQLTPNEDAENLLPDSTTISVIRLHLDADELTSIGWKAIDALLPQLMHLKLVNIVMKHHSLALFYSDSLKLAKRMPVTCRAGRLLLSTTLLSDESVRNHVPSSDVRQRLQELREARLQAETEERLKPHDEMRLRNKFCLGKVRHIFTS